MSLLTEPKRLLPDNYNDVAPLGLSNSLMVAGGTDAFSASAGK